MVQVSVQDVPPDAAADREPDPPGNRRGHLEPVIKLVVRGVPARHDAACLPPAALGHRGHRASVVVPVEALEPPSLLLAQRRIHAAIPRVGPAWPSARHCGPDQP